MVCTTQNVCQIAEITPLGYFETVPGETISGTIEVDCFSAPTKGVTVNPAYLDIYVFWTPFRLLDETWPDFISQNDPSATVPTVNETFPWNFEKRLCLSTNTLNVAWQRYMYNTILNKFFVISGGTPYALDATSRIQSAYRPSTWHEAIMAAADTTSETIDTSGTTTDVQTIRDAFHKDEWRIMRNYYGERYIDYLRATGVEANWNVADEPEVLAVSLNKMPYKVIDPTANEDSVGVNEYPTGRLGGYWNKKAKVTIPRKFLPEHGLVGIYGVPRIEQYTIGQQYPLLAKQSQDDYWSPELDTIDVKEFNESLWDQAGTTGTRQMPAFMDLTTGMNMTPYTSAGFQGYSLITDSTSASGYLVPTAADYTAIMQDVLGDVPGGTDPVHFSMSCTHRLNKLTPISTMRGKPIR